MNARVILDMESRGPGVKVDSTRLSASGSGSILATTALYQDRAFFEVSLRSKGTDGRVCCGVAQRIDSDLMDGHLSDFGNGKAWFYDSDISVGAGTTTIIGVALDQDLACLRIFIDGKEISFDRERRQGKIRGVIYPAISLSGDVSVALNFSGNFKFPVSGYDGIIAAMDLV